MKETLQGWNHRAEYVAVVYVFKDYLRYSSKAAALNDTVKDGEMIQFVWFLNENLSTAHLI